MSISPALKGRNNKALGEAQRSKAFDKGKVQGLKGWDNDYRIPHHIKYPCPSGP
jgi:hypothetical protein